MATRLFANFSAPIHPPPHPLSGRMTHLCMPTPRNFIAPGRSTSIAKRYVSHQCACVVVLLTITSQSAHVECVVEERLPQLIEGSPYGSTITVGHIIQWRKTRLSSSRTHCRSLDVYGNPNSRRATAMHDTTLEHTSPCFQSTGLLIRPWLRRVRVRLHSNT